ncbi:unnamed protein product [Cylindrotheca closterium]|uniref:HSF-type DNA-binding domain-containing protein n=1 Tax=Cylindrotheca closterium TaxID=2856 RepID=A0AAD2CIS2_9STRA|nr:unnamed protein product [Cylindrotheca closterium]
MNPPSSDSQSKLLPGRTESIHERPPSNSPSLPAPPFGGWIPSGTLPLPPSGDSTLQFPWKLHQMLETVETEGNASIISWLAVHPQDTFKVHKKEEFMEQVLPRFFDQTKYKSFLRQLNLWGFERVLKGPCRGGYRHSLFIKNQPNLCNQMKRTKIKGTKQGDSGDSSQQQLTEGERHNMMISHFSDEHRVGIKTNDLYDETSFDTIEYEKIPVNLPIAADLYRMYDDETIHVPILPTAEAEDPYSPIPLYRV